MSSGRRSVKLEIITPREMFYTGQVEMLSVPTVSGQEGFMAGHIWCVKLLTAEGDVKIREAGVSQLKTAVIHGGYVDIKDDFIVYTDGAEWKE